MMLLDAAYCLDELSAPSIKTCSMPTPGEALAFGGKFNLSEHGQARAAAVLAAVVRKAAEHE